MQTGNGIFQGGNPVNPVLGSPTVTGDFSVLGDVSLAGPAKVIVWASKTKIYGGGTDGTLDLWNNAQTGFSRLNFGPSGQANTTSRLQKAVTGISNAVATDVLTVTIPNAAHSATLRVTLTGSLGAGGAIGANEATGTISYNFSIARTAGVATVATASSAYGSATSSVAGAATITITAAASAMTGAVGAQQTFTVQATISRGTGSSTNHTCLVEATILNANSTGVTIA